MRQLEVPEHGSPWQRPRGRPLGRGAIGWCRDSRWLLPWRAPVSWDRRRCGGSRSDLLYANGSVRRSTPNGRHRQPELGGLAPRRGPRDDHLLGIRTAEDPGACAVGRHAPGCVDVDGDGLATPCHAHGRIGGRLEAPGPRCGSSRDRRPGTAPPAPTAHRSHAPLTRSRRREGRTPRRSARRANGVSMASLPRPYDAGGGPRPPTPR